MKKILFALCIIKFDIQQNLLWNVFLGVVSFWSDTLPYRQRVNDTINTKNMSQNRSFCMLIYVYTGLRIVYNMNARNQTIMIPWKHIYIYMLTLGMVSLVKMSKYMLKTYVYVDIKQYEFGKYVDIGHGKFCISPAVEVLIRVDIIKLLPNIL